MPTELESDTSSIDSRDPFGAAPFDQLTVSTSSSAQPVSLPPGSFHPQYSTIALSPLLRHVLTRSTPPPIPQRTTSRGFHV